jgi:hypothetical protein
VAPVFTLRGGLLVLFSIMLPFHKFIRSGGSLRRGFPYQGRYPPATRPDTVEDGGDDNDVDGVKTGHFLIGDFQVQAPSGCFVLRLGVFRASFGFLSREGFPPGRPWAPSGPPFGPGRLRPLCGGRRRRPLFPIPSLILDST